ncbi:hypothetical protein ANANG_G00078170 [Anguilla anguilla]|uniref:Uncharacterized protein n=1 Tax=Anguilla anguilla TaxID=7936 RepID=A0A9D3MLQ2_ANGAN|nr:hypothetical protein ANANG_G00078170 [Anguilla anguilla]
MADPLRRTLLAKLRGKKSKKGTTAGGCGVAANGGREALIENVHSSITATRELRVSAFSETRSPLNTITVSKKRNWLQQSSGKDGLPTTGAVEDHGQAAGSPGPPPRAAGRRPPTGAQPRAVDPAEENDADDEGEIWYNPIPEDEEPELDPHGGARAAAGPPAPERAPPEEEQRQGL